MIKGLHIISDKYFQVNKIEIHDLIKEVLAHLGKKLESLSINFVDQKTILNVNQEHLKHGYTTDIITFNYSGENDNLDGEIIISYIDAFKNAKKFNVSFESEIARLVIHGLLHLVGLDDQESSEKRIMKKSENLLVKKYSFTIKTKLNKYDC